MIIVSNSSLNVSMKVKTKKFFLSQLFNYKKLFEMAGNKECNDIIS